MLQVIDLIERKKRGAPLSAEELDFLVQGYTAGRIPDYQMAAWLMAVCCRGLDEQETFYLTQAMLNSGSTLDLTGLPGITVDKHSTGGVGDKTTLVLAPLLAAAGLTVVKMAGRGLGFTGGTIDKLEAIPGYRVALEKEELLEQARQVGVVVVSPTLGLVPADKKMYALRDATATVDSLPLIAASVMSKKLAAAAQAILLDVKVGRGALMSDRGQAARLAELMVGIGRKYGRRMAAVFTSMDEPLGRAVGNALEVAEAVETLAGRGPADLREACLELATRLVLLAEQADTTEVARSWLEELLNGGTALEKYREWIRAQGGDPDPERLPQPRAGWAFLSPREGYLTALDARLVGQAAGLLGAGRAQLEEQIDPAAGIVLQAKTGDYVRRGQELARLYADDPEKLRPAERLVAQAFTWGATPPPTQPLVLGYIG